MPKTRRKRGLGDQAGTSTVTNFPSRSQNVEADENLREYKYRDKICDYCSSSKEEVRHHHFSTSMQRVFSILWTDGNFMCPICQQPEPAVKSANTEHRVILSDSTLYGVWNSPDMPKISAHFEMECIVGGKIRDLTRALKKNILRNDYRFEIIIIAGINNIGEGQSAKEFINEFKEMKALVAQHSVVNMHDKPSYISICTLSLPPKYCALKLPEDTSNLAEWIPSPSFRNKYPVIKLVNEAIKEMNMEDNLAYFNLHLHGIRMLKGGPQHKFDTRPGANKIWREEEVFRKLHFTSENKLKIVKYLQNTFQNNKERVLT